MQKDEVIKIVKETTAKNGIKKAFLFGSFARGEKYRDLDIVIEAPKEFTLMDLARVANEIKEKIHLEVDLITTRSINPRMKHSIQKDMMAI